MNFYDIISKEKVLEIVSGIKKESWIYEKSSYREVMDVQVVKEKFRKIIEHVRE